MPTITLTTIPGFSDLSNAPLASGKNALGAHFTRINSNAAFGLVRLEIFTGNYAHGQTVVLPQSPVDGYTYGRDELIYMWGIQNTADAKSGWASYREPWTMWYGIWNVDQATGVVFSEVGYRGNQDHKDNQATTNDGVLQVFTIAQRQKTKLLIASSPSFNRHVDADFATDFALTTGLMTDINGDAKFGVINQEVIYMGEFFNGATVPQPISPADAHTYAYADCVFMTSMRWTADTDSNNNPIKPAITKGQLQDWTANVGTSGAVRIGNTSVEYESSGSHTYTNGKVAVFAFCTRALGTTFPTIQNSFAEIADSVFAPGQTLRASTVKQLNRNIGQAVCSPEFFGFTNYSNSNTIPLPTSPLDGYTYVRAELMYIWDWFNTGPSSNSTGRISLINSTIDGSGVVTINDWRFDSGASGVALRHEGVIRVLVVAHRARSNAAPPAFLLGPPAFGTDDVSDKYGNLDFIPDGSVNVKGSAGDLAYRPLTNALTATNAGTVAVAAFTNRIKSRGDLSLNSASLTSLSLDTLYYITYDDPLLVGQSLGAVTYTARLLKEDALGVYGRFLVGSINTPKAGAIDTVGNYDGGVGAQHGSTTAIYFPSFNSVPAGNGAVANINNGIDLDASTFAQLSVTGNSGVNSIAIGPGGGILTPMLKKWISLNIEITFSVPTNTLNGAAGARVNIVNAQTGQLTTVGPGVTAAMQKYIAPIPVTTNLSQLNITIQARTLGSDTAGTLLLNIYEVRLVGVE
jgi:hypothetical protein